MKSLCSGLWWGVKGPVIETGSQRGAFPVMVSLVLTIVCKFRMAPAESISNPA